jgi:hypothetical protein
LIGGSPVHVLVKPTDQALRMLSEIIVGVETLVRFRNPGQFFLLPKASKIA